MIFFAVMDASNEVCQRLHTPPRALLNMDITQRNAHQLQTRASISPPPPAPVSVRDSNPPLHPPLSALVSQRREALVRTNPRIRPVSDFYNGEFQHLQTKLFFTEYSHSALPES